MSCHRVVVVVVVVRYGWVDVWVLGVRLEGKAEGRREGRKEGQREERKQGRRGGESEREEGEI